MLLLAERASCSYSEQETRKLLAHKRTILSELEELDCEHEEKYGKPIFYQNQLDESERIVARLKDRSIVNTMVLAKTQSGKTGLMCATIKRYMEDPEVKMFHSHIYVLTGVSSNEWKIQTKERLPERIQKNVFHRQDLEKAIKEISKKQNVLVIMDEIQVAAKKDQSLDKLFKRYGLGDLQTLYRNDVKIVEFTATPDGTIYDLMKWSQGTCKLQVEPGQGYVGCADLLRRGSVRPNKPLHGVPREDIVSNIAELREAVNRFSVPKYHIIRVKKSRKTDTERQTKENFEHVFGEVCDYIPYDQGRDNNSFFDEKNEVYDINYLLCRQPEKHTFIFIKEMLRCAKTLNKTHLGVLYERYTTNINDSTIIQGLVGRNTGYDTNSDTVVFTHIPSIEQYELLWQSGFEDTSVEWNSNTTTRRHDQTHSSNTFNRGSDASTESESTTEPEEPVVMYFRTYEEAMEFYQTHLKPILQQREGNEGKRLRGPNKPKQNTEGFVEADIRGKKRVYSKEEMYRERRCNIKNGAGYGFRACYGDVTNPNTLQFCLMYYE